MDQICRDGIRGAVIALLSIFVFQGILVMLARKKSNGRDKKNITYWDLIVTSEDESYSLSRLQIYLWTIVVVTAFFAVFFALNKIPVIPESIYILLGVNVATTVASTAIYTTKSGTAGVVTATNAAAEAANAVTNATNAAVSATNAAAALGVNNETIAAAKTAADVATSVAGTAVNAAKRAADVASKADTQPKKDSPDFWEDIFFEANGSLDLPRTQMCLWTAIILIVFIVIVVQNFKNHDLGKLPDVGYGLLTLMGISHGAYLGAKAAK